MSYYSEIVEKFEFAIKGSFNLTSNLMGLSSEENMLFLWLAIQRIVEDDMSGPQTRHDGLPSRRLQSQAMAVHSAAGLPVWLGSELVLSWYPGQDPGRWQKQVNLLRGQSHLLMMVQCRPPFKTIPRLYLCDLIPESLLVSMTTPFTTWRWYTSHSYLRSTIPDSSGMSLLRPPPIIIIYLYVFYCIRPLK